MLLHGLTATRRYVVMGSRALERSGHRVIAYDARAHGQSDRAGPEDYGYDRLAARPARRARRPRHRPGRPGRRLDGRAHAHASSRSLHPERVAGLVIMTPAYDPEDRRPGAMDRWDRLAEGLRERRRRGVRRGLRHAERPREVARDDRPRPAPAALRPRPPGRAGRRAAGRPALAPVRGLGASCSAIDAPTVIVASRDEVDPEHPYAIGERYAEAIPGARLVSEEPRATSPLAWQGAQVSKVISEVADAAAAAP